MNYDVKCGWIVCHVVGIQGCLGHLAHNIDDLIFLFPVINMSDQMQTHRMFNLSAEFQYCHLNWHTIFPSLRHYAKLLRKLKRDLPAYKNAWFDYDIN